MVKFTSQEQKIWGIQDSGELYALWKVCKDTADEKNVPDLKEGTFADSEFGTYKKLKKVRSRIGKYVKDEKELEKIGEKMKSSRPGDIYYEIISQGERRPSGQFWTPRIISRRMISHWDKCDSVFDVGAGWGEFLKAASEFGIEKLAGIEKSPILIDLARYEMSDVNADLQLIWGDFILTDELPEADLWLCNPPYTRHHAIPEPFKDTYQNKIHEITEISRISSLFVYFFLRFLQLRDKWSFASFICPRSLVDSRRSSPIKSLLKRLKALEQIDIFEDQNVFEGIDTGSGIFYLSKGKDEFSLINCSLNDDEVKETQKGKFSLSELGNGNSWSNLLSRGKGIPEDGIQLKELFEVKRGIATGANKFFVLTEEKAKELSLPNKVLRPVLAKTRYCQSTRFTQEDWEQLREKGKEVYLLDISEDEHLKSPAIQKYLKEGKNKGIPKRSLVQTRSKWFKVEKRGIPTFFFTYLSRQNPRFNLNESDAVALNSFICLESKVNLDKETKYEIWRYLNSKNAREQLKCLGRNYGGDTLKAEPRELDELKIPSHLAPVAIQFSLKEFPLK